MGELDLCPSSKGLGFYTSEAPPLSQLNSWDMTSEQNTVRKQRGWVMRLVRRGYRKDTEHLYHAFVYSIISLTLGLPCSNLRRLHQFRTFFKKVPWKLSLEKNL